MSEVITLASSPIFQGLPLIRLGHTVLLVKWTKPRAPGLFKILYEHQDLLAKSPAALPQEAEWPSFRAGVQLPQ